MPPYSVQRSGIAHGRRQVVALPDITMPLADARTVVAPASNRREKNTGSVRSTATFTHSPGVGGAPAGHAPTVVVTDAGAITSPQTLCCCTTAWAAAAAAGRSDGSTNASDTTPACAAASTAFCT